MANILKAENSEVVLGKMEVTENRDITKKYQVIWVPVFKFFFMGNLLKEYEGPREVEHLAQWARQACNINVIAPRVNLIQ